MNLARLQLVAYGAAGVFAAVVAYQVLRNGKKIAQAAAETLQAVNPINPNNVIYQAASSVSQAITGSTAPTLGGQIADRLQPDPMKIADAYASANPRQIDIRYINQMNPNALPAQYYYW